MDRPLLGFVFLIVFALVSFGIGIWVLTGALRDLKAATAWPQRAFYLGVMIFGLALIRAGWYWLEGIWPQPGFP